MTRRAISGFSTRLLTSAVLAAFWTSNPVASAESPRLELHKGDRIILIGNTLAERMQYYGHVETLLHARASPN